MNNTHFRRLVLDTPSRSNENSLGKPPGEAGEKLSALGSRMRSSIPMTPRSIAGSSTIDFTRQLAQQNAELNLGQAKKFRSSLAPKGTKLAAGYQDRTKLRVSEDEDEKATRVKALEDMVKLGQIDETTFRSLRDEIVGERIQDVHLVKGLDYKLLERVRQGEDVLVEKPTEKKAEQSAEITETTIDLEGELEKLEAQVVAPLAKEEKAKQGAMAPPTTIGKKRTRDDILKDLRAARTATLADLSPQPPALGSRFKKLGEKREKSRIEHDDKGREVLVLVDAEGNVKRKVKKGNNFSTAANDNGLLLPDKTKAPLGMEVSPTKLSPPEEPDDLDIFEGVGADFNPLGDATNSDDEGSADESTGSNYANGQKASSIASNVKPTRLSSPEREAKIDRPPNYFDEPDMIKDTTSPAPNPLTDPTILAALKKAAKIQGEGADTPKDEEESAKLARRKRLFETHDRDAEDIDLGFGGSRFGDEEDADETKRVKLSVWGDGKDQDEEKGQSRKEKRKRAPKKRKGDGESMADVMKVMERRKGESR